MSTGFGLSKERLRERLVNITQEIGSERLAEASQSGCLDSIVSSIIETQDVERIARMLFSDFPGGESIINSILDYNEEGLKYALPVVLSSIGNAAWTGDADAVKRVAEALSQPVVLETVKAYKGRYGSIEVAKAIGNAAWTGDADAVKRVAERELSKLVYLDTLGSF